MPVRAALDPTPTDIDRIGFFGKLPTHGDFVSAGLGRPVQNAIDAWLQESLLTVQQEFGKDWERRFKAMPGWRFIVEDGLWGLATIAGVIVPSLDRVGRYFPLVIAAQLHAFSEDPRCLCLDDPWFTATEGMAETSRRRDFDIDFFTSGLRRLRTPRAGEFDAEVKQAGFSSPGAFWWRTDPGDRQMRGFHVNGAPRPTDFLRLLTEDVFAEPGAPESEPVVNLQKKLPASSKPVPVPQPTSLRLSHSYASHPGTRLTLNADSVFSSSAPPLFAIADGVGDGNDAAEASAIAAGVLKEVAPQETIEALVQEIKGKLGRAHGLLQSGAMVADRISPSASIVVLATHAGSFALLWAGDARCYLLRDGMMRCLTRDHVAIGLKRSLSRGLGLRGQLTPDVVLDESRPGDRFLLCSNPLPRALSERGIAEILLSADLDEVSAVLAQEALIANCRENISALVVDVSAGRG